MSSSITEEAQVMPQASTHNIVNGYPVSTNYVVHNNNIRDAQAAPPVTTATTRNVANQESSEPSCSCSPRFYVPLLLMVAGCIIIPIVLAEVYSNFNDPKFEVESLSVSSFNLSDSRLTAIWDVSISVRNGNRYTSFTYLDFKVSVFHHTEWNPISLNMPFLSMGEVASFHQPTKNTTLTSARLSVYMLNIDDQIARAMAKERGLDDGINFDVFIQAKIRCNRHLYSSRTYLTRALCKVVKVGFSPNTTEGKTLGPAITCSTISPYEMVRNMDGYS